MAKIDDTQRVFDVSKPSKVSPSATSRPVIVGHTPMMNDPMVRDNDVVSVPVAMDDEPRSPNEPAVAEDPIIEPVIPQEPPKEDPQESKETKYTSLNSMLDDKEESGPVAKNDGGDMGHLVGALPLPHPPGAGPKASWKKIMAWAAGLLLLVLIGGYLAIDTGLVNTSIKLPLHIFGNSKGEEPATTQPSSQQAGQAAKTKHSMPEGFEMYEVEGAGVSFGYPTVWGAPTATKDPGFSKRGGSNQSDGTHAYIINFSGNKDIQIALTSGAYLPAVRAAEYYDFLKWCRGTSDTKFYQATLLFTSANQIDTPSTITCNQGPLENTVQPSDQSLKQTTILQSKAKGADGKELGDIYVLNLDHKTVVVLRAKDATMANGENLIQLLKTIDLSE